MNKFFIKLLIVLLLAPNFNLYADPIIKETFNPNYIISDFELENYNSLNLAEIEYFLDTQNGILKNYILSDPESDKVMTAGEVIYDAAQKYQINPKYLLVLLQKEQSLITDPYPSEKQLNWATGFAICDSCVMNDPRLEKYSGFYNQVFYAAQRNRFYIKNNQEQWLFQINQEYNIDGHQIMPLNQATVNLYNYTPHYNGNLNFWKIWQKWFTRRYPNGSILKAHSSPAIWLIENGKRRPFITWNAFISRYDAQDIREVSYNDLNKYEIGPYIKFTNYAYLKAPDGSVYLVDGDNLRKFANQEVVRSFGVNPEEMIDISWDDYNYYQKGEPIEISSIYPNGIILENEDTGDLYYVKDAYKHLVLDRKILESNFGEYLITKVSAAELDKLENAEALEFKSGTILKSNDSAAVYVFSDHKLRPIINAGIFEKLGYNWSEIVVVDSEILKNYEIGDLLDSSIEDISDEDLLPTTESNPL